MMRAGEKKLNLEDDQIEDALREYDERGFSFQPNRWDGDTIVSREWVCRELDKGRDRLHQGLAPVRSKVLRRPREPSEPDQLPAGWPPSGVRNG
jgi:hypothetical protein